MGNVSPRSSSSTASRAIRRITSHFGEPRLPGALVGYRGQNLRRYRILPVLGQRDHFFQRLFQQRGHATILPADKRRRRAARSHVAEDIFKMSAMTNQPSDGPFCSN